MQRRQERVFMDPSMRLFEYDKRSLLANIPEMYAFQKVRGRFLKIIQHMYNVHYLAALRHIYSLATQNRRIRQR